MNINYQLPRLPYEPNALEPVLSQEQLWLHYDKHHKNYVIKANSFFDQINNGAVDLIEISHKLSFNLGGHILHSLFWDNLQPIDQSERNDLSDGSLLMEQFENKDRLIEKIVQTGKNIEGSGWVALSYDPVSDKCLITVIGNHNLYLYPNCQIILVIDCWEHAYYLDYKNDREKYLEKICSIINWSEVENRLSAIR